MTEQQLLISERPATSQQKRALAVAGNLIFLVLLITLPFRNVALPRIYAFIPVVDAVLMMVDLLTSTLLLAQGVVLRSRALVALASGYLFTALIIVPHALTFPGAFTEAGLLDAGVSTTLWIYCAWHIGLPIAVIAYVTLRRTDRSKPSTPALSNLSIAMWIALPVVLAIAVTLLTTAGHALLPVMMTDAIHWISHRVAILAGLVLALLVAAMVMIWRQQQRSILDLWLLLVMWAWMMELLLVITISTRFSLGWYAGRTAGLLSGVLVLVLLMAETSRLYAQAAVTLTRRQHEQEGRMLTMNEVAASIAHEVKQPLAAIVATADTGRMLLARKPPVVGELPDILQSISEQGLRAAHVVDSIRAMFARRQHEKGPVDLNDLIRETTMFLRHELSGAQVALQLDLGEVPRVMADRLQLQHVFLNLFANAIEAMTAVRDRDKVLTVCTELQRSGGVLITVQDSGPGIEATSLSRIFDPFYTTKPHGTGMGLPLCRSIVAAHGGSLWAAERAAVSGATFHVHLPGVMA